MRLLLDESVPSRLRHSLTDHSVRTVVESGWSGVKNGKLLALAATEFDAFVTVDKNLPYQQKPGDPAYRVGCARRSIKRTFSLGAAGTFAPARAFYAQAKIIRSRKSGLTSGWSGRAEEHWRMSEVSTCR